MKLERLLGVPRAARTVHLVINIPAPVAPLAAVSPSPKPTVWARIWAVLKVAGPASVATAAIIIAILSLQEQNSANRDQQLANKAAVGSTERHDAEQVSFLQNRIPQPPSLVVKNFGTTPVYIVRFDVEAIATPTANTSVGGAFTLWLGDIPACSSGIVNIVPAVVKILQEASGLKASQIQAGALEIAVDSMSFADSNGLDWQYFSAGGLQQVPSLSKFPSSRSGFVHFVQATYKSATGCA